MNEPEDELDFAGPSTSPQISSPPLRDPTPVPVTRSGRANRIPARFRDTLPEVGAPMVEEIPAEIAIPRHTVTLLVRDSIKTTMNRFKMWRSYLHRPTYDPDSSGKAVEDVLQKFSGVPTKRRQQDNSTQSREDSAAAAKPASNPAPKTKTLNLQTPKVHFLGDYGGHIRRFGSTAGFLSQIGEHNHTFGKRDYTRTNKRNATSQIAKLNRRREILRRGIQDRTKTSKSQILGPPTHSHHVGFAATQEPLDIVPDQEPQDSNDEITPDDDGDDDSIDEDDLEDDLGENGSDPGDGDDDDLGAFDGEDDDFIDDGFGELWY
ncbi:hypothetical protein C8J56DRAFT_880945 [Mycena floridula]|nr:hypothetical protein C8J56DRAFT_880945 [Mycena floridula]